MPTADEVQQRIESGIPGARAEVQTSDDVHFAAHVVAEAFRGISRVQQHRPIAGKIARIEYIKGKKTPATSNDASFVNERNSLLIESDEMTVKCTQIAGILARRIVCWPSTGDNLERGQKFGLIKFGSRTDLLMPPDLQIEVRLGDKVRGGETIIARKK